MEGRLCPSAVPELVSHVWAERYDRDLEDIFAVQDEVTCSIVAAVPGHLEFDIVEASRRKPTESLGAYDHYLRGREIVNRWQNDDSDFREHIARSIRQNFRHRSA